MPKANPKHRKSPTEIPEMGKRKRAGKCDISNCSNSVKQHVAKSNIEKFSEKLKWELKPSAKKARKVGVCKNHYKEYKKLQKKEEKYSRYRDFDGSNKPSKYKSNAFLE